MRWRASFSLAYSRVLGRLRSGGKKKKKKNQVGCELTQFSSLQRDEVAREGTGREAKKGELQNVVVFCAVCIRI